MVGAVRALPRLAAQRDRAPRVRRREPRADRRRPRPEHRRDPPAGLPRPRHPAPSRLSGCALRTCDAGEPAGSDRRAGTVQGMFRIALALIALRIVDTTSSSRRRHRADRSPRQRPRTAGAARPRRVLLSTARSGGGQGVLALATGLFGVTIGVDAVHYARELGLSADDVSGFLSIAAGLALMGLGAVDLWRSRRADRWRYPRRVLYVVGLYLGVGIVVVPVGLGYVGTKVGRAVVPANHLGVALREREVRDQGRAGARGLVHPVAQRRRRDLLPGPQRPAAPGAHARPPRLRRAALRPPRRGSQRRRAEHLRLGRRRGHQGRRPLPADARRRRPEAHRRHRPLRRRRADARGRGRDARTCARSSPTAPAPARRARPSTPRALSTTDKLLSGISNGLKDATMTIATGQTPPKHLKDLVGKIAPRPLLLIADPESDNGEKLNRLYYQAREASPRRCGRSRAPATSTAPSRARPSTSSASSASSTRPFNDETPAARSVPRAPEVGGS